MVKREGGMATIEISCVEVWREISNYLDEEISPELRERMEAHFKTCAHCTAVLDGTRNVVGRSEERRVGKECRSLCDWSSDVCSSDLPRRGDFSRVARENGSAFQNLCALYCGARRHPKRRREIGRASCRERV